MTASYDNFDRGVGPAPHCWQVARDPDIPVREQAGIEFAAAALDSLMAGLSPEDRADMLDALREDLAEGGSISVYLGDEGQS